MSGISQRKITTVTLNPALDHTLYFAEFQIGQLNRVNKERLDPGGKGINVAKVIKALGHQVAVTGFLGIDNDKVFDAYFRQQQIEDFFIRVSGATRANVKIVDEASGQVTEVNFPGLTCSAEELAKLETTIRQLASPDNLFVLSGSLPPGVSTDIYRQLIALLQQSGCKVFLDASGEALAEGIKAKPYTVKPNLDELSQLTGRELLTESEVLTAMNEILAAGVEQVVVSLGSRGALVADKASRLRIKPPRVQANSTVGAGDSLVAGLTVGEAQGLPLTDRVRLATAAAAAAVATLGTQPGSLLDVEKLMSQVIIEEIGDN